MRYNVKPRPGATKREIALLAALQRIADCSEADLLQYTRKVDDIACTALVEYENK
jgi:hypothetical protein